MATSLGLNLTVTPDEEQRIRDAAWKARLSISRWVLMACLDKLERESESV